jgi:hypothetical protein
MKLGLSLSNKGIDWGYLRTQRMLRRIFGFKRDEVTNVLKIHDEELQNL